MDLLFGFARKDFNLWRLRKGFDPSKYISQHNDRILISLIFEWMDEMEIHMYVAPIMVDDELRFQGKIKYKKFNREIVLESYIEKKRATLSLISFININYEFLFIKMNLDSVFYSYEVFLLNADNPEFSNISIGLNDDGLGIISLKSFINLLVSNRKLGPVKLINLLYNEYYE